MYQYDNIHALLDKYWEGETSLEEERLLKSYFASAEVDERLQQYAPLFRAIHEEQSVQLLKPKALPLRPQMYQWLSFAAAASVALLLAAGAWWLFSPPEVVLVIADHPAVELPQTVEEQAIPAETQFVIQDHPKQAKRQIRPRKIIGKPPASVINAEEEAAMAEIKAALALVSSKIRKGRHEAAKGAIHLEEVDRIFKREEG